MEYLNWELSVLSRALRYDNLSAAALHVGMSQPQLSRIVAKIEADLEINLLERKSKRNSAWTPAAIKLSELYSETLRSFRGRLQDLTQETQMSRLRIGCLEGLVSHVLRFADMTFKKNSVEVFEILVEDLNILEETFSKKGIDLLLSFREPGRKKFRYVKELGFQVVKNEGNKKGVPVVSSFEYGTRFETTRGKNKAPSKILVSNSLQVRREWIQSYGGMGTLPSEVLRLRPASDPASIQPVLLIGQEDLPEKVWNGLLAEIAKLPRVTGS
ncbi:LysR family transcriptional regulator [bacterium]|jgi:hypothetical protein|nr:LysR family transcriptional regulator [bacterium]